MVFPDIQAVSSRGTGGEAKPPTTHVVPAAHGFAWEVKAGQRFRVVDLYGEQVVDFAAWVQGTDLKEKLSMAYTRYHLSGTTPAVGEYLWTNHDDPILKITADTVKVQMKRGPDRCFWYWANEAGSRYDLHVLLP